MDVSILRKWFLSRRGKYVNVIIAGQVFGGRIDESPQLVHELWIEQNKFTIGFATTETLVVTNPSGFVREYSQLIVPDADEVLFGWHYYGRPQLPENWCEEIYRKQGSDVVYLRRGPLSPGEGRFKYEGERFVELL